MRKVFNLKVPALAAPIAAALLALLGAAYFAKAVHAHYPIQHWLFWRVASLWGWLALFTLGCLGSGLAVLERGFKLREAPLLERASLAMAVGVIVFTLLMYVAGTLAWYGPILAVALPLLMTVAGSRELWAAVKGARRALEQPLPRSPLVWAITAFGILCLGVMYLELMTPDALNYDSTWCHLTVAQDYARAGRIVPFPADYSRNVPHLTSIVHTWGFSLPGLTPPLRWMMALHTEFVFFLWTLAGVSAVVRWIVDEPSLRGAWVAYFLFPYIFVYDHNIGGAADHVLAFFAAPLLLAARDVYRTLSPRSSLLFGALAGGALLTKYQAIYLVLPILPFLGLRWLGLFIARLRRGAAESGAVTGLHPRAPWAPLAMVGALSIVSAPHFLKNLIFYKNPVYPFMQSVFSHSTPTVPNAWFYVEYVFKDHSWVPQGTLATKLVNAAKLFFKFSFEPHYSFTRSFPGFGSLFTLLLPAVLIAAPRRRVAFVAAVASGGVLLWTLTFNVDRNLQIVLPLMVCATAALIVKLWQLGWIARLGLVPLVGLQLVWGGDAMFYSGQERLNSSIALIKSGFDGRAQKRFDEYRQAYVAVGRALPKDARVLLHNSHISLGIDREIVLDWTGFQGLFAYGGVHTPEELFRYYRARGVTHLLYVPRDRPAASRQEEVLWSAFVSRHAKQLGTFGPYHLLAMPSAAPAREEPYKVASFGMPGYQDGLYPIEAMSTIEYVWPPELRYRPPARALAPDRSDAREIAESADAVLVGQGSPLERRLSPALHGFSATVKYAGQFSLYLRKR